MPKRSGSTKATRFNAASGLTQKELNTLTDYAYGSDQDINRMLRGLSDPADKARVQDLVRQIDSGTLMW